MALFFHNLLLILSINIVIPLEANNIIGRYVSIRYLEGVVSSAEYTNIVKIEKIYHNKRYLLVNLNFEKSPIAAKTNRKKMYGFKIKIK